MAAGLCLTEAGRADDRKPNIVFILADDLGWADTQLYGATSFYQTPNILRLAQRGMIFTRAYSANPLCSPTRFSIMTGINPARSGFTSAAGHIEGAMLKKAVNPSGSPWKKTGEVSQVTRMDPAYVTLAETLKAAGYATAHFGKWHLGFNRKGHPEDHYEPMDRGFDIDIPHVPSVPGPRGGYAAHLSKFPEMGCWKPASPEDNVEDFICDEAVKYMQQHRDEPFFLNYWAFSVHAPFDSKPELVEKYTERLNASGSQRYPVYAAMVEVFDSAVGRLLNEIDRLGLADNTIIVFYSDNGGVMYEKRDGVVVTSNAPLRGGKATIYEGGSHVPAVVVWPGKIRPGSVSDALISSTDWFPTLLDMVNITPPETVRFDGIDQVPSLLGKDAPRKQLLCHFPHYFPTVPNEPAAYLIDGDWKLIRYYCKAEDQTDIFELYNLKEDPSESHDLAKQFPERLDQMKSALADELAAKEAAVPVPNPDYNPSTPKPGLLLEKAVLSEQISARPLFHDTFDGPVGSEVRGSTPAGLASSLAGRVWRGSGSFVRDGSGNVESKSLSSYQSIGFDISGAYTDADTLRLTVVLANDEDNWAGIGFARSGAANSMDTNFGWVNIFGDRHEPAGSGKIWAGPGAKGRMARLSSGLWKSGTTNTVVLEYNLKDDGDGNGNIKVYINGTLSGALADTSSVGMPDDVTLNFNNTGGVTKGGQFFSEVTLEIIPAQEKRTADHESKAQM